MCDSTHTAVVNDLEPACPPVVAPVPDSADARLFIELSSYAADLIEATVALDLATRARREGEVLDGAIPVLVGAAAVAYSRTFMPSSVRRVHRGFWPSGQRNPVTHNSSGCGRVLGPKTHQMGRIPRAIKRGHE